MSVVILILTQDKHGEFGLPTRCAVGPFDSYDEAVAYRKKAPEPWDAYTWLNSAIEVLNEPTKRLKQRRPQGSGPTDTPAAQAAERWTLKPQSWRCPTCGDEDCDGVDCGK